MNTQPVRRLTCVQAGVHGGHQAPGTNGDQKTLVYAFVYHHEES